MKRYSVVFRDRNGSEFYLGDIPVDFTELVIITDQDSGAGLGISTEFHTELPSAFTRSDLETVTWNTPMQGAEL